MLTPSLKGRALTAISLVLCMSTTAFAQSSAAQPAGNGDDAELAKKLSNPISDLVSVPFQFNWEQNVGPDKQTRFILNVQPVMPFSLTPKLNLIARVIVPFVSQPPLSVGGTAASGISDILTSFFFSPKTGGTFTWGAGPVISLPSTTEPTLGTEKWSAGPTIVALKQAGPWTVGALWNQLWSFSGNTSRQDVNQMFVQPFLAYTTNNALTITVQSESVANFKADTDRWTVPINLLFSRSRRLERFRPAIKSASADTPSIPTADRHGRFEERSSFCCRGAAAKSASGSPEFREPRFRGTSGMSEALRPEQRPRRLSVQTGDLVTRHK